MARPVRIAIDAREAVGQRAGKGRYLAGLLRGLAALNEPGVEYVLYTRQPLPQEVVLPSNAEVVVLPTIRLPGIRPLWVAWDLRRRHVDAFLSPTGFLPAIFSSVPVTIIVHDMAVWLARNHPRSVVFQEKTLLPLALARAAKILVVSKNTGHDLQKLFHVDSSRIVVAPGAVDPQYRPLTDANHDQREADRVRTQYDLPSAYILFVGTLEPRKNIRRLIEAYHGLPSELKERTPLVVTGKKGWGYAEIFTRVKALGEEKNIRFLGYVPDEDLPVLYALATVAAYPSLYEGFGLPPLEAMASGAAVVTSNTSSIPEVVGDAALLVDPTNEAEIRQAVERLLNDTKLRTQLSRRGVIQAKHFTWTGTAKIILQTLRSTIRR